MVSGAGDNTGRRSETRNVPSSLSFRRRPSPRSRLSKKDADWETIGCRSVKSENVMVLEDQVLELKMKEINTACAEK